MSAFDELGKKLNRLPSFHRALTSASITSLTSMHSQSIHLSKSLQLTNGPSLNSIHSLRLANTPTAINNSLIRFDTDSATPITHNNNNNNKASMSPSLPSISDKAVINIQHTQSYSKSMTQTYTINNINNININKSIINPFSAKTCIICVVGAIISRIFKWYTRFYITTFNICIWCKKTLDFPTDGL